MKNILFLILSVINTLTLCGQIKIWPSQIEINFPDYVSKELRQLKPITFRNGQFYTIKINNINTLLYKVQITGIHYEYSTESSADLNKLFGMNGSELSTETARKGVENSDQAKKSISDITKDMKEKFESENELVEKCEKYAHSLSFIKDLQNDYILNKSIVTSKLNYKDIKSKIKNANYDNKIEEFKDFYEEAERQYELLEEKYKLDNDTLQFIKEKLSELEMAHESVLASINAITTKLFQIKLFVENENNFTIVSTPMQMAGDYSKIKVEIEPIDSKSGDGKIMWEMKFHSNSGLKIDYSVGPIFRFGKYAGNDLIHKKNLNDSISFVINNGGFLTPSLSAMMHIYDRSSTYHTFGGTFGVSANFTSLDSLNLGFLLGGSYIIGRKKKVIITLGASANRVNIFNNKLYSYDKLYSLDTDFSDLTKNVFKASFFFSISYNLSRIKEAEE